MTKSRALIAFAVLAVVCAFALAPASAKTTTVDRSGTYLWTNVVVPSDDDVQGDITVIGGDADIAGRVDGDVTVVGGTLTRESGSVVTGDVNAVGGSVGSWIPFMPGARTIAAENARLMSRLAYSVIVVLAFLIFPVRVRTALDRLEHHPGLSAATGVVALVAFLPIALVLLISIVGWPLIPVEFIALFAGILIGQAALGALIGRRVYELIRPHTTPAPLAALILGLVILSAAEILPAVGGLVTGLVWLLGLGAAILAFIRETTFMPGGMATASAPAGPRPPLGGPPMPV